MRTTNGRRIKQLRNFSVNGTTTAAGDAVKLQLDNGHYPIREAADVIRLDGTTCLQLTNAGGIRRIKQACFDAGQPVIIQVNESRD